MGTLSYTLSNSAIRDLQNIISYTRKMFGDDQLQRYLDQLEKCAGNLATGKGHIRQLAEIHVDIRYTHCAHHYIYGIEMANAPFQIIAILNERMDLMSRLKNRL